MRTAVEERRIVGQLESDLGLLPWRELRKIRESDLLRRQQLRQRDAVRRVGAGVPLVVGMMDYPSKSGGLGPAIWPTGDYKADMAKVAEIYAKVTPKHPAKGMTAVLAKDEE